ncbi:MAG: agmatinase, partial [Hyphomicrobiaceae bacterium]
MARSFLPVSSLQSPRFSGAATFMRLPLLDPASDDLGDVHVGLIGVPWDGGTTNRPGARHGPRQLRDLSTMIRRLHPVTGFDPFGSFNCADLGDVPVNPADLQDTLQRITAFYEPIAERGIL